LIAGNDASVQLDGYAIRFHLQLLQKRRECERRFEIPSFAIDLQFHIIWDSRSQRVPTASELSSFARPRSRGRCPPRDHLAYASTLRRWNLRVAVRPE
jgi:hypothetical protein